MSLRFRFPWKRRLMLTLKHGANVLARTLSAPFRKDAVLLVCASPDGDKANELAQRLRFIIELSGRPTPVLRAERLTLMDPWRYEAVAVGDNADLSPALRRIATSVFDIDYNRNPMDGWALAELATHLTRARTSARRSEARRRFASTVARIRASGDRPVYLLGTGPSLARAIDHDFSDGTVVVCNTIVRDRALWAHLKPSILVAGDAIYHFGHTAHARAFRADAAARLREANGATVFVYPEIFDAVVRAEFHDLHEVLIPIPFGRHTDVTVDLSRHFGLPLLGNVLNLLLLPVGASLGKDLRLWGFDGRAPGDQGFWANSSAQAYTELIPTIRAAHPAFFDSMIPVGRESDYVKSVHGDALEMRLQIAEASGFSIEMMHFSWTPTMRKRFRGPVPDGVSAT